MNRRSTVVVEIRIVSVQKRLQPADFKKMECMKMIIPENYFSDCGDDADQNLLVQAVIPHRGGLIFDRFL